MKEPPKEEFSDWPQGLLTIGTFGNRDLRVNTQEIQPMDQNPETEEAVPQQDQCTSPDFSEFTSEEVGKLQKELTKLLSRKPAVLKPEEQPPPIADLPLDRFLNCPSSLEVDRNSSNRFSTYSDDKDEEEIDRTIRIILGRCKDVCEKKKKKSIGKKSLSFLVKKVFACTSGFVPTPSLRDTFQESRMEKVRTPPYLKNQMNQDHIHKIRPLLGMHIYYVHIYFLQLLRTMLTKKMYPQGASRTSSTKKYLDDYRPNLEAEKEEEKRKERRDGSKWDKTDSDCEFLCLI